ncbi:MAG: EAL domain-containing protein [Lachnospiraceae bacterium]|nr:EAL domain-containing protein [Lachnospiraceae bacterium]
MEKIKMINQKILSNIFFKVIRDAFLNLSPVFIVGGIVIMLINFPFPAYQSFITTFSGGIIYTVLNVLNQMTFGMASLYLVVTISYSYCINYECMEDLIPTILTGESCYFIVTDIFGSKGDYAAFGVQGVFVAILTGYMSALLLHVLLRFRKEKYQTGIVMSDLRFYKALSYIPFLVIVILAFLVLDTVICNLTNEPNIYAMEVDSITYLFSLSGNSFGTAFLMTLVNSVMWFFGIHGSNVIEPAMARIFTPLIYENMIRASVGAAPRNILCKEFFDLFILMGGCGTSFSLLLAIFFFSKKKSTRDIAKVASLPMLFNINEIMVFGIPLILNPYLIVPFVVVPLCSLVISYGAIASGLVPMITSQVSWTTPVLLSGYVGTGSIRGSILQIVNLGIGMMIYKPFLRMYEESSSDETVFLYNKLVSYLQNSEDEVRLISLTERHDDVGIFARGFQAEIKKAIDQNEMELYYQPQFNPKGECIGAEALLRWNHPDLGMVYPPLIIQLAEEGGYNLQLEKRILARTISDAREIRQQTGFNKKISVNVSGGVIQTKEYVKALEYHIKNHSFEEGEICLEVTEQKAMLSRERAYMSLDEIRKMGYLLAIDDFSMGHTSLKYLMAHPFDIVKMDGALVRGLVSGSKHRVTDLVRSIMDLSNQLGFDVIAEYVETEEQKDVLHCLGCDIYQGWYYSKAIPKQEFMELLQKQRNS